MYSSLFFLRGACPFSPNSMTISCSCSVSPAVFNMFDISDIDVSVIESTLACGFIRYLYAFSFLKYLKTNRLVVLVFNIFINPFLVVGNALRALRTSRISPVPLTGGRYRSVAWRYRANQSPHCKTVPPGGARFNRSPKTKINWLANARA